MSRWLQRALADIGTPASVPIAPLAPIGPPAQAIGTIGTNGTGPAMAEDWQAHYDERAAIRQSDGELPKWEAESSRVQRHDCGSRHSTNRTVALRQRS